MLQSISSVFVVYRHKTLTGSPDPMHANRMDKPCKSVTVGVSSFIASIVANSHDSPRDRILHPGSDVLVILNT